MCKTDETAYKFVWDKMLVPDYAYPFVKLLGIIIGKALFDRIPLNCYLHRGIWRRVAGFNVFLHDSYSYDKDVIILAFSYIRVGDLLLIPHNPRT